MKDLKGSFVGLLCPPKGRKMSEIYAKIGKLEARIEYDHNPQNPRTEYDHNTTIVCQTSWGGSSPTGFSGDYVCSEEVFEAERKASEFFSIPANDLISNRDRIERAMIRLSKAEFLQEWGYKRWNRYAAQKARKYLEGYLEEYLAFYHGEVFGYEIIDEDGECLDSCWGYYDRKYCEECAKDALIREALKRQPLRTEAIPYQIAIF